MNEVDVSNRSTMGESIRYNIINIRTNQFAVINSEINKDLPEIDMNNQYSYGIDVERGVFNCVISITFSQKGNILLKIETEASYRLHPDYMKILVKDDKFEMSVKAVGFFTSLLYGATRGILVCKLEGTSLSNIILPPVNFNVAIDRPLVIPLNEA